jgi:hypothetical protein
MNKAKEGKTMQSPFKKRSIVQKDGSDGSTHGGESLRGLKKISKTKLVILALIIPAIIGVALWRSFAEDTGNPYTCPKTNSAFPALKLGSKDGDTKLVGEKCVSALQWAFKFKGNQSQITINGTYDDATKSGALNFQKYFKLSPADGNMTSSQMAIFAYIFGYKNIELPPPPRNSWAPAYPGQPRPEYVYWGSSKQENGDPSQIEADGGAPLGVRRTFWNLGNIDSAVNTAKGDLAAGRLPIVSFSVAGSEWAAIGTGSQDTKINSILTKLEALEGPVFVAFQHEPEDNGGTPAAHIAMNKRVRERMTALQTKDISLVQILMGYTYTAAWATKNPDLTHDKWYADNIYDLLGIDIYYGDGSDNKRIIEQPNLALARKFAKTKQKDILVGEWGMVLNQDTIDATRMRELFNDSIATNQPADQARIVGLCYFNSTVGQWGAFVDPAKPLYKMYVDILNDKGATHWRDEKAGVAL